MPQLQLKFGVIDPAAKADIGDITAQDKKPWSVIDDLCYDNLPLPANYATMEWNHDIDDQVEFPDIPNPIDTWGLWSDSYSDANGDFTNPPTLDITFSANHKSPGLTFYFYPHSDDYASAVRVTWYYSTGSIILANEYTITSTIGVVTEPVEDYRHIKIEFLSTNIRHRFVKLYALEYGIVRLLQDDEIDSCKILEEIDPTVETISINTLNCRMRTRDSIFSPITSPSHDDMMMRRQPMTVTRDGTPFGTFFLEDWEDPYQSGLVFDFRAGDAVSVMDLYTFWGGIYANKPVTELLDEIFNIVFPTGLIKYELEDIYATSTVTGWIPICGCGEAFQHICFALNAVADTSRREYVWIYQRDTDVTFNIQLNEQYLKGRDGPTKYISGVDVVSYDYVPGIETTQAYSGSLPVGQHTIRFTEPLHSLTISGGTIITAHPNYAVVNVPTAAGVTLTGNKYLSNPLVHSIRAEIAAGEVETVKKFEGYTLVSRDIADYILHKEFEWFQNRILTENDVRLGDKEVGYIADLKTRGRDVIGTIVSLESNLRADKSTMRVVGNIAMD